MNYSNKENVTAVSQLSFSQILKQKDLIKNEIIAGFTAFFAISYIIIVNPLILADAGIPAELSVFATIFVSTIGCLIMGLWANAPIILTPGMGVNAFFTYTIVINMGLSWQEALAISLLAGLVHMLVAFTRLSVILAKAIPQSLKIGITVGIGLFLVEIGLEKAQLIQAGTNSIITLGSLQNPMALLSIFGLLLSLALYLRKISGGFFIAIVITSIVGYILHIQNITTSGISISEIRNYPALLAQADFTHIASIPFALATFSMSMIIVFESMGILEGILPDKNKFKKSFEVSSLMTCASSLLGTSPTVAAAESAAGIESGGRTGITAITTAILFALSTFFIPFLSYIPQAAIAPVIIITGAIMMQQLQFIEFNDFSEWFPAFLIIVLIPLTGSISVGLAFGFACYPILKIFIGKPKMIHPIAYGLGILFIIDLVFNAII